MNNPDDEIELLLKEERVNEQLRNLEWLSQLQTFLLGLQLLVVVLTVLGSLITARGW